MSRQESCEERIGKRLEGRLETMKGLRDAQGVYDDETLSQLSPEGREAIQDHTGQDTSDMDPDDVRETAQTAAWEWPLAVTTLRVVRIDLSTGGPGDWFEVFVDENNDVTSIVYHFNDWFDHAERTLDGDDFNAAHDFLVSNYLEGALLTQ